jgi:uncharacterized membrane protein
VKQGVPEGLAGSVDKKLSTTGTRIGQGKTHFKKQRKHMEKTKSSQQRSNQDLFPVDRMLAFSDGLTAFAATLLVLGIHIPLRSELGQQSLFAAMLEQWPFYLSFFISFMLITLFWLNHHNLFRYIHKADHTLLIINSFLLMDVVLLPFGAALLGEYAPLTVEYARTAALIYGGLVLAAGIPINLLLWYAIKTPGLVESEESMKKLKAIRRHFNRGPILYLAAMALALVNVWASLALYVVLILLYILPVDLFIGNVGAKSSRATR